MDALFAVLVPIGALSQNAVICRNVGCNGCRRFLDARGDFARPNIIYIVALNLLGEFATPSSRLTANFRWDRRQNDAYEQGDIGHYYYG